MEDPKLDTELFHELESLGAQELDEEAATAVADRVVDQLTSELSHHPRAHHEKVGDDVSHVLHLQPELDKAVFLDELKGLKQVDVRLEYAVGGRGNDLGPEAQPEATVAWLSQSDVATQVVLRGGEVPVVSSWKIGLDGAQHDIRHSFLTGSQAMTLQGVMNGVGTVLEEQSVFIDKGKGSPPKSADHARRGRGSLD